MFRLYSSINNLPVIAASSVNDNTIKETYNSVPFGEAMDEMRVPHLAPRLIQVILFL